MLMLQFYVVFILQKKTPAQLNSNGLELKYIKLKMSQE